MQSVKIGLLSITSPGYQYRYDICSYTLKFSFKQVSLNIFDQLHIIIFILIFSSFLKYLPQDLVNFLKFQHTFFLIRTIKFQLDRLGSSFGYIHYQDLTHAKKNKNSIKIFSYVQ